MSLEKRIRARIANGDDAFTTSYKAAIEEMNNQKASPKIIEDDLLL
jgi:hypothetical protein